MTFIEIADYDGNVIAINVARIISIRKSSGRVHDYGSVTLDTGETIAFNSSSATDRLLLLIKATVIT